jgi:hypothetical protein
MTDGTTGAAGGGVKSGEAEWAATGARDGFPFGAAGGARTERGAPTIPAVGAGDGFSTTGVGTGGLKIVGGVVFCCPAARGAVCVAEGWTASLRTSDAEAGGVGVAEEGTTDGTTGRGAGDRETGGVGPAEEGTTDGTTGAAGGGVKSGEAEWAATGASDEFPFGVAGGATTEWGVPAVLVVGAGDGFSTTCVRAGGPKIVGGGVVFCCPAARGAVCVAEG